MSKTKTPFFSLGAQGSVAQMLTAQQGGGLTLLRQKPFPADPLTLAQQYQRWDYQDYVYAWHQLTASQKQTWEADARRLRLTGFAYFMKDRLTTLPDLLGRWRLDEADGAIARDSSRNGNNGTIFGATHTPGYISNCLSFDGVDDYVSIPNSATLKNYTALTIMFWINTALKAGVSWQEPINQGYWGAPFGFRVGINDNTNTIAFNLRNTAGVTGARSSTFADNIWEHHAVTWDASDIIAYRNGVPGASVAFTGNVDPTVPLILARRQAVVNHWGGLLDQVSIYNRALDAQEILRHAERRYPR